MLLRVADVDSQEFESLDAHYPKGGVIRVESLDELKRRILQGIDEMDAAPVQYRWKKFDHVMSERV